MLPRSCLRLADSKSNSSTRLPRRTTTRVSSGWAASISILFGIDQSHAGRRPRARLRLPRGRSESGRAWLAIVEWDGLGDEKRQPIVQAGIGPRRGVAVMLIRLILDARTDHDPSADGQGGNGFAAAVLGLTAPTRGAPANGNATRPASPRGSGPRPATLQPRAVP